MRSASTAASTAPSPAATACTQPRSRSGLATAALIGSDPPPRSSNAHATRPSEVSSCCSCAADRGKSVRRIAARRGGARPTARLMRRSCSAAGSSFRSRISARTSAPSSLAPSASWLAAVLSSRADSATAPMRAASAGPSTSRTAAAPRTRTSGGAAPAAAAGASADAAAAGRRRWHRRGAGAGAGASALRKDRGTRPRRPSAF